MSHNGLPAELNTILSRPEAFPVLSPSEAAMIRAWLKATPPPARNPVHVARGIISADWQYEMAVYNRDRQRLTLVLEYHEQLLAAPIAPEHEHAAPDAEPSALAANGRTWQEVQGCLLRELEDNAPPRSMDAWAEHLRCSKSTVAKAMGKAPKLRRLLKERSPRAQSINDVVIDTVKADGQNPADAAADRLDNVEQQRLDAALARLMGKATPEERARLNAKPRSELNELARQLLAQEADGKQTRRDGTTRLMNRKP